jgi:hypothetical protein
LQLANETAGCYPQTDIEFAMKTRWTGFTVEALELQAATAPWQSSFPPRAKHIAAHSDRPFLRSGCVANRARIASPEVKNGCADAPASASLGRTLLLHRRYRDARNVVRGGATVAMSCWWSAIRPQVFSAKACTLSTGFMF